MCVPNCLFTYCYQLVYKLGISCLTLTMYIHIRADMFYILLIVLLGFMERNKIQIHNLYLLTDVIPVIHEGKQMGRACRMYGRVFSLWMSQKALECCVLITL